jgi:hypothetical protein
VRLRRDAKGIETLPIMLLLGTVLGAYTLGIGIRCLASAQKLSGMQRAIDSFNALVERARIVCAGGKGNVQQIELDLPTGRIIIEGRLLQLVIGDEVRRSEVLPLPVLSDGYGVREIVNGRYAIELQSNSRGEYFLELREI